VTGACFALETLESLSELNTFQGIILIFDQIKVSRVPQGIGHASVFSKMRITLYYVDSPFNFNILGILLKSTGKLFFCILGAR